MPSRSVILDEEHFRVAEDKARALGTTTDEFVTKLIDVEQALTDVSFDHLLSPVRKEFEHLNDEELDSLFADAQGRISDKKNK